MEQEIIFLILKQEKERTEGIQRKRKMKGTKGKGKQKGKKWETER